MSLFIHIFDYLWNYDFYSNTYVILTAIIYDLHNFYYYCFFLIIQQNKYINNDIDTKASFSIDKHETRRKNDSLNCYCLILLGY